MSLQSGDRLGSREVCKILVVRNDVGRMVKGLEVMPPELESFEYGEKLLVMCVVVELCTIERAAVECDGVNTIVVHEVAKNSSAGMTAEIGQI